MLDDLQRIHNSFQIAPFTRGDLANAQRLLQQIQVRKHPNLPPPTFHVTSQSHFECFLSGHNDRSTSVALKDRLFMGEGTKSSSTLQAHEYSDGADRSTFARRLLCKRCKYTSPRLINQFCSGTLWNFMYDIN